MSEPCQDPINTIDGNSVGIVVNGLGVPDVVPILNSQSFLKKHIMGITNLHHHQHAPVHLIYQSDALIILAGQRESITTNAVKQTFKKQFNYKYI